MLLIAEQDSSWSMNEEVSAMDDLACLGANSLRLVAKTFGEVRHFYEAFDTAEEARSLVKLLCSDSDSIFDAFLESAVQNLLQWRISAGPSMKRRRRLHLERIAGTLLLPGKPAPSKPTLEFEEIVHNDPKAFLEAARRAQKGTKDLGGLGSRAEKENRDRRRYALELASSIEESCLPVALQIVALDKPEIAWLRVWGSRRAKTLRNRFRAWNKFRSWLNATYGVVWPKDATQVVNFIEELIDYGCPVSYPNELLAVLSLLEQVGKVPFQAHCRRSLLAGTLEKLEGGFGRKGKGEGTCKAIRRGHHDITGALGCQ